MQEQLFVSYQHHPIGLLAISCFRYQKISEASCWNFFFQNRRSRPPSATLFLSSQALSVPEIHFRQGKAVPRLPVFQDDLCSTLMLKGGECVSQGTPGRDTSRAAGRQERELSSVGVWGFQTFNRFEKH